MIEINKRESEAQRPFNQLVELWHPSLTQVTNDLGGQVDVAGKVCEFWASVEAKKGLERQEVGRFVPYRYYEIQTHYDPRIQESMYLKHNGKVLDIESIIDAEERHMYISLSCVERVMPDG